MLNYFPKYFSSKAISVYFAAIIISNLLLFNHILDWKWWLFGIVEAVGFFYYSSELSVKWLKFNERRFLKKVFITAFLIRLVWVLFSYVFYTIMTGKPFEFDCADSGGYHVEATMISALLKEGNLQPYWDMAVRLRKGPSDMGYPFYLGFQYFFTDDSILFERIIKSLLGAFSCILMYRLAFRSFGESTARLAAIFCMLMPNMILYSGLHVKEVEMVCLTIWYMERADFMLRNKNFNFAEIAPPVVLAGSLFLFRTVLGFTAIFSLFTAVLFTSNKIMNFGKRMIIFIWLIGVTAFFVGGTISNEIEAVWKDREKNQEESMQMRTNQVNGNKFAKYMGAAVFAPMIFAIPFPTVVETPLQQNQKIINGGNYVKNILAFFVLIAVVFILKEGKWREYLLIGTFVIGYLAILSMSAFAQAERFHQPVLPFEILLACYGIHVISNKQIKYFTWWQALIFVAILGWSWFKLAGRGMA